MPEITPWHAGEAKVKNSKPNKLIAGSAASARNFVGSCPRAGAIADVSRDNLDETGATI